MLLDQVVVISIHWTAASVPFGYFFCGDDDLGKFENGDHQVIVIGIAINFG